MVIPFSVQRLHESVSILAYPTPKVVHIRNWKLGLLRYALLTTIFLFIFVNQMLLYGKHLRTVSVSGNAQVSFQLPTFGNCDSFRNGCGVDFTPIDKLSYCRQGKTPSESQKMCAYRDPTELGDASSGQGVLIPTNIKTFVQQRSCFPEKTNLWSCPHGIFEYVNPDEKVQPSDKSAEPWSDLFVADVERFRLLLDHSAISDGGVNAESFQMSGTWVNCSAGLNSCSEEPILCISPSCESDEERRKKSLQLLKRSAPLSSDRAVDKALNKTQEESNSTSRKATMLRKMRRNAESMLTAMDMAVTQGELGYMQQPPGGSLEKVEDEYVQNAMENNLAVSLQRGDVFPVSLLLQMAGVKLDDTPAFRNKSSYRDEGFSLTIRIQYSNIVPWVGMLVLPWRPHGRQSLHYRVEAIRHPSQSFSRRVIREEHKNFTSGRLMGRRVVEEDYGIAVAVQQFGDMKVWDFSHFLVVLTTTLAMLAVSNCILDTIALGCMDRSSEYKRLKFESYSPMAADQGKGDDHCASFGDMP
eukprot:TRINITY_DN94728_c0_g1_i1.p1 TRINITY_DN94728_c0_g1~~TRINITY_DN94728_c0_g1_i1.p1  ORF type:complete len:527 (+),score=106.88 TRINITY_DN94728_c0_g1_i1:130-1710(+)